MTEGKDMAVQMEELTGSIDQILNFAQCDSETASKFKTQVAAYKNTQNKS